MGQTANNSDSNIEEWSSSRVTSDTPNTQQCHQLTNSEILNLFPADKQFKESLENVIQRAEQVTELQDLLSVDRKGLQTKVGRLHKKVREMTRNKKSIELSKLKMMMFELPKPKVTPEACGIEDEVKKLKLKIMTDRTKTVINENRSLKRYIYDVTNENEILDTQIKKYENKTDTLFSLLEIINKKYKDATKSVSNLAQMKKKCEQWEQKYLQLSEQLENTLSLLQEKKEQLQKQCTRNLNKKIKRRDEKLECKENLLKESNAKISEKQSEVETLKERCDKKESEIMALKRDKNKLLVQVCRERKKTRSESVGSELKSKIEQLKLEIEMKESKIVELEELNESLNSPIIEAFQNGKYINEIRETIMTLVTEYGVSQKKVNGVIQVVLKNLTGKCLSSLPSTGVKSRLLVEAKYVAQKQVADAMLQSEGGNLESMRGNCLHQDGTSKFHHHFQSFQVTTHDKRTYSLGLIEVGSANADTLFKSFQQAIEGVANVIKGDKEQNISKLVSSIVATMSDQGATNPVFNKQLCELKESLLPDVYGNWDNLTPDLQREMCRVSSFFCKMHIFVNVANEVDKCLSVFESSLCEGKNPFSFDWKESGAARLTRTVSKALTMKGCQKSGVGSHFETFLQNKGKKCKLITFRGHRFNHLFCVAGTVYHHLPDIKEFVSTWADPNDLLKSVAFDIRELAYISGVRALGIIDKLITGPFWKIIESAENVLDLNPQLEHLRNKLIDLCKDSSTLLSGECVFPGVAVNKNDIYESLFAESLDPVLDTYTQMALELASGGMLLILERQAKDQLPGGKFYDAPINDQLRANAVPATNTCSERDFAQLDILMRVKPSASTECYESVIMWTNNKTSNWLNNIDVNEKNELLDKARSSAPELIESFKGKQHQLFNLKLETLKAKQDKKEKQEMKTYKEKVRLTGKINEVGGLWLSLNDINTYKEKVSEQHKKDQLLRDAIIAQLQYRKLVLNSKGSREKFQQQVKGEMYTISKLQSNLLEIIELNKELEHEETNDKLTYKPMTEVSNEIEQAKENLAVKIEEGRNKIKILQQQTLLPHYISNPELLVGCRIKHKFRVPSTREIEWFMGSVLELKNNNGRKSKYRVRYDGEDEDCLFTLLIDIEKGELMVL